MIASFKDIETRIITIRIFFANEIFQLLSVEGCFLATAKKKWLVSLNHRLRWLANNPFIYCKKR